jgi:hypothetical protein
MKNSKNELENNKILLTLLYDYKILNQIKINHLENINIYQKEKDYLITTISKKNLPSKSLDNLKTELLIINEKIDNIEKKIIIIDKKLEEINSVFIDHPLFLENDFEHNLLEKIDKL